MFGSLGAAVQVVLILYPFILLSYNWVHIELISCLHLAQPLTRMPLIFHQGVGDVDSFCHIHTLEAPFYFIFYFFKCSLLLGCSLPLCLPLLSLNLFSVIWWCPQWWASIVPLSSLASCLVHKTPTSHRYPVVSRCIYFIQKLLFSLRMVTSKFLSDNRQLCFTAYPELCTACVFTHSW